jgi:HAD superfamily hydrolase (TIGR01509 family)
MPALIFDCDGVLADTEMHGHLPAFNQTFREFGVPVQWSVEEYGEKVKIGGGKERMRSEFTADLAARWDDFPADEQAIDELVLSMHRRKTALYTELIASGAVEPRPGVGRVAPPAPGWLLAVASTSAEPSVRAVLRRAVGEGLAARFEVFAGDIVPRKKPAPDIYLHALEVLGVGADDAVVVEDSGIGLRAARGAGLPTIVTVSAYTSDDDFEGEHLEAGGEALTHRAALVVSSLGDVGAGEPMTVLAAAGEPPEGDLDLDDILPARLSERAPGHDRDITPGGLS